MGVLEKLAPQKKKCIRGNNMHFKNKTLIEVHRKSFVKSISKIWMSIQQN